MLGAVEIRVLREIRAHKDHLVPKERKASKVYPARKVKRERKAHRDHRAPQDRRAIRETRRRPTFAQFRLTAL